MGLGAHQSEKDSAGENMNCKHKDKCPGTCVCGKYLCLEGGEDVGEHCCVCKKKLCGVCQGGRRGIAGVHPQCREIFERRMRETADAGRGGASGCRGGC